MSGDARKPARQTIAIVQDIGRPGGGPRRVIRQRLISEGDPALPAPSEGHKATWALTVGVRRGRYANHIN